MLNREFNCIRYELPSVCTCNIKTFLLKYKLKWNCSFLLLGALTSNKGSEALHSQHQLPTFCQDFQFFCGKIEIVPKRSKLLKAQLLSLVSNFCPFFKLWFSSYSPYKWNQRTNWLRIGLSLTFSTLLVSFTLNSPQEDGGTILLGLGGP